MRAPRRLLAQCLAYAAFLGVFLFFLRATAAGEALNGWMNERVAATCAAALRWMGMDAAAEGQKLFTLSYTVRILDECNGLLATALLAAACLTFPCDWRRRLAGAAGSVPVVFALNQLRLISVMLVGSRWPGFVDFYEEFLVRGAHWALALAAFWVWARWGVRRKHDEGEGLARRNSDGRIAARAV